jgi:hypothetical protein
MMQERKSNMTTEHTNIGRGFWFAWVLASMVGFALGPVLGVFVAYGLFDKGVFDATIGITAGLVIGATGGCLQWVVLRGKVARAGWWVPASALGFGITLGTLGAIGLDENLALAGLLFAAVFGIACGGPQSLVLRRAGIARAGMWVPASILGGLVAAIGVPMGSAIAATGSYALIYALSAMVFGLLLGAALGAVPGAALVWRLRQSQSGNFEGMATA